MPQPDMIEAINSGIHGFFPSRTDANVPSDPEALGMSFLNRRQQDLRFEHEINFERIYSLLLERADQRGSGLRIVYLHINHGMIASGAINQRSGSINMGSGNQAQGRSFLEVQRIAEVAAWITNAGDAMCQQLRAGKDIPEVIVVIHQSRQQ